MELHCVFFIDNPKMPRMELHCSHRLVDGGGDGGGGGECMMVIVNA